MRFWIWIEPNHGNGSVDYMAAAIEPHWSSVVGGWRLPKGSLPVDLCDQQAKILLDGQKIDLTECLEITCEIAEIWEGVS